MKIAKHEHRFCFFSLFLMVFLCGPALQGCTYLGIRSIPVDRLEKKYVNNHSGFIEISGARVHFREEGSGPPLVLLHGVMASLHTWDAWAEKLKDDFRIIRVDAPGHGLTGPVPGFEFTEQGLIEFVEKFVDAIKLDSFFMAGNSLGGLMAWNYAVKHPKKVNKLILIAPAGYPQKAPGIIRLVALPVIGNIGRFAAPRFMVASNVKQVYGDKKRVEESLIDRYHELLLRPGNRGAMVEIFRALNKRTADPDLGGKITQLCVPTLLMWGEKDRWVPPEHIKKWKKDVPGIKVITYPGAGHVPMEEIPEQTARDALDFLCGQD